MTELEIAKAQYRPLIAALMPAIMKQVEAKVRARAATKTFSADSDDDADTSTTFSADDVPKFADYFAADDSGCYPGHLHRTFGMGVKAFADAAGLRRKCVMSNGSPSWVWAERQKKAEPQTFAARPGLTLQEVKPGVHRWVKEGGSDEGQDHHPETGEHANDAAERKRTAKGDGSEVSGRMAGDAYLAKLLAGMPPEQRAKAEGVAGSVGTKVNKFLLDNAGLVGRLGQGAAVLDSLFTTPEDVQKYPWLASKWAGGVTGGDHIADAIGIPGGVFANIVSNALASAWKGLRKAAGFSDMDGGLDAAAELLAGMLDAATDGMGLPPADVGAIRAGLAGLGGAKTFADEPTEDDGGNLNDALAEALLDYTIAAKEAGEDPTAGIDYIRQHFDDPSELEGMAATFSDRGGLELKEVKPGIHRWVRPDSGEEHEMHPDSGESAKDAASKTKPAESPERAKPKRELTDEDRELLTEDGFSNDEDFHHLESQIIEPTQGDLSKPSIILWHGTSSKAAKKISRDGELAEGPRGLNASATIDHAAEYPEDTGADSLILIRAKTSGLDVDPNDQQGDTVEEGLFPKSGHGSSCSVGDHEVVAVINMRKGVDREKAFEALKRGDLLGAMYAGASVTFHQKPKDSAQYSARTYSAVGATCFAWSEKDHPRGKNGHFIAKGDIEAAKTDPAKAAELRAKVKPEDAAKLDKQLGEAPKGPSVGQKRAVAKERGAELLAKMAKSADLRGKFTADDLHALADHLADPAVTVAHLREVRQAMRGNAINAGYGGAKAKAGMVAALVEHAKGAAFEARLKEQGVTGEAADEMRRAAGRMPKEEAKVEEPTPEPEVKAPEASPTIDPDADLIAETNQRNAAYRQRIADSKEQPPLSDRPIPSGPGTDAARRAIEEAKKKEAGKPSAEPASSPPVSPSRLPGGDAKAEDIPTLTGDNLRRDGWESTTNHALHSTSQKTKKAAQEKAAELQRGGGSGSPFEYAISKQGNEWAVHKRRHGRTLDPDATPTPPRTPRNTGRADDAAPTQEEIDAASKPYVPAEKPAAAPPADDATDMGKLLDQPAGVPPGSRTGDAVARKEDAQAKRTGTPEVGREAAKPDAERAFEHVRDGGDIESAMGMISKLPHKDLEKQLNDIGVFTGAKTRKELLARVQKEMEANHTPQARAKNAKDSADNSLTVAARHELNTLRDGMIPVNASAEAMKRFGLTNEQWRKENEAGSPRIAAVNREVAEKEMRDRLTKLDPNVPEHASIIAEANKHLSPASQPEPESPKEVRQEHADAIEQAKNTDKKFKGEGRYEAEAWQKIKAKNPGAAMPTLSREGAEYAADLYESDGKPIPPEVLAAKNGKSPTPTPEPSAPVPKVDQSPAKPTKEPKTKPAPVPKADAAKANVPAGHKPVAEIPGGAVTAKDPKTGELSTHFPPGMREEAVKKLGKQLADAVDEEISFGDGYANVSTIVAQMERATGAPRAEILAAIDEMQKHRAFGLTTMVEGKDLQAIDKGQKNGLAMDGSKGLGDAFLWVNGNPAARLQRSEAKTPEDMMANYAKYKEKFSPKPDNSAQSPQNTSTAVDTGKRVGNNSPVEPPKTGGGNAGGGKVGNKTMTAKHLQNTPGVSFYDETGNGFTPMGDDHFDGHENIEDVTADPDGDTVLKITPTKQRRRMGKGSVIEMYTPKPMFAIVPRGKMEIGKMGRSQIESHYNPQEDS